MIEAAWIEAGYWRIERDLWCCPRCHAATPKPDEHTEWHTWASMTQGQRLKAMLRREAERKANNAD